jgi:hypothetical protein
MPETGRTDVADLKMRLMRAEKFARISGDRSEVDDLRRQCVEAKIAAYVQRVVAEGSTAHRRSKESVEITFLDGG